MARDLTKGGGTIGLGVGTIGALLNGLAKFSVHSHASFRTATGTGTDNRILHALINSTTTTGLVLGIFNGGSSPVLRVGARSVSGDSLATKDGATTVSVGKHSFGGVVDIAGDNIKVYLDGILDASGSASFANGVWTLGTPSASHDMIGCESSGDAATPASSARQYDGIINEITIWNDDIGDSAFSILNSGYSGILVQPSKVIFHMRLGLANPDVSIVP